MKRLALFLLPLVFLGVGCLNFGNNKPKVPDGGVFKTTDAGQTWVQVTAVPTVQGVGTLSTTNVGQLVLDPNDEAFLYLATQNNGLLYSEDVAVSWEQPRGAMMKDGTVSAVAVDPKDSCTVYVAKGPRLYKSTNCMRSFVDGVYVETRPNITITEIAADWYTKGNVFIGLSNGDVLKSADGGKSWKSLLKTGFSVTGILFSNKDSRQMLVSSVDSGIQRTLDSGEHWDKVVGNKVALGTTESIYRFVQTKDGSTVFASTKNGIARSTDFGFTWQPLKLLTAPGEVTIRALGISPTDPKIIYYATTSTFYRSADGGVTWETKKFPSARIPQTLQVDPKDSSVLYIGVVEPTKK